MFKLKLFKITKRLSIWILLIIQLILIFSYFVLKIDNQIDESNKITFLNAENNVFPPTTYHTINSRIILPRTNINRHFIDFNSSLCYLNGTDIATMKRTKDNWECKCLSTWHGKDCGQPEIVWRALLTQKKASKISGPRTFPRRLIYLFPVDKYTETLTEIRINELEDIVDLFVLIETDSSDYFRRQLDNFYLKRHHDSILYLKSSQLEHFYRTIPNLRNDDIILSTKNDEIPNKFGINFLKFYNKLPDRVLFRLRWSVYGFFWVHPRRTVITGGASTISHFRNNLNNKLALLQSNQSANTIILGDLNHLGGWYCEYCTDAGAIPRHLNDFPVVTAEKIDSAFVEDAIENGLYIDGKTELLRKRRYLDNYFAPFYAINNHWKYDFLMINFYSKIDYYEG